MLNFYTLHTHPQDLEHYDKQDELVDVWMGDAELYGLKLDHSMEQIIAKDPRASYEYAVYFIKRPFDLGSRTILNSKYKDKYEDFVRMWHYHNDRD